MACREQIRCELDAILASIEFRGSQRGQTLLRYLVENALDDGVDRLKERTIGVELFHRDAAYDTGQDAIVRVAANDVRKRLAAHYKRCDTASGGVRISLPPGSYTPEFEVLEHAVAAPGPAEMIGPVPAAPARAPGRFRIEWAAIGVFAVMAALFGLENVKLRSTAAKPAGLTMLPWSQIAAPGVTIPLITADSNFALYKDLIGSDQPLSVYTSRQWLDELATRLPSIPGLVRMPFTSIGDVSVAARIGSTLRMGGCSVSVRSGRMVQVDDFKSDRSMILLGSAYSNPWVSLVNDRLNFRIDYDPASKKQVCIDGSPHMGESPVYVGTARTPNPGVGYAIISLVPNLSHDGYILIIAGTNMEGTEAAGELVTDLPRLAGALRSRGIEPTGKVEQLELLLRLDHYGTQSSRSEIIAHRITR